MSKGPYSYLKKNPIVVELASDVNSPRSHKIELLPEQEKEAMRIHKENIIFDLHNHVHCLPENTERDFESYARSGRVGTGFEGITLSGITACFNGYGGSVGRRSSPVPWQLEDIIWDIGMRQADIYHHSDVVMVGTSVKDIAEAKKSGRCAIFANVENAGIIGNDLDRLDVLYGLGVRCLGLSYNQRNTIADGSNESQDGGLSKFGEKALERMNQLGILVDLSHSSDQTILDALELSTAPCCLSHSVPRAMCAHPKAKTDELLKKMAKKDWVLGIQSVPNVTSLQEYQSIYDVVAQIEHAIEVMGIDHVAIGTDAMFGDHLGLHHVIRKILSHADTPMPGKYVDYLENPGEFPNITRVFVSRGYKEEDMRKLLGGNVVRLLERTIG
jgi:membrane dipeptidase